MFDRLGKKVHSGTFGKIRVGYREYPKGPSVKTTKICSDPISADPICPFPIALALAALVAGAGGGCQGRPGGALLRERGREDLVQAPLILLVSLALLLSLVSCVLLYYIIVYIYIYIYTVRRRISWHLPNIVA